MALPAFTLKLYLLQLPKGYQFTVVKRHEVIVFLLHKLLHIDGPPDRISLF